MAILFDFLLLESQTLKMLKPEKPFEIVKPNFSFHRWKTMAQRGKATCLRSHCTRHSNSSYFTSVESKSVDFSSWGKLPEVFWHRLDMDATIWGAIL